jgi:uncharacterized protein YggE
MKTALIAGFGVLVLASTVLAQPISERQRPPSITVGGEALIAVEPDQAQIEIGVTSEARTAPDASRDNAERLARVLAEVKTLVGADGEARTSGYTLAPQFRYPQGGKPEIVGYLVQNSIRVKTKKLDAVGKLIDAAMRAGANNVNRMLFTLQDEESVRLEALRKAARQAKAKAEGIAAALGLKVVRIAAVAEGDRSAQPLYRPVPLARAGAMAASAPTPVEPGTVEVRASVTLTAEVAER